MNAVPRTRYSLILRLPNGSDVQAWTEFATIYEPFVYRFARRRGLQDADAQELVQEVFLGVARAVKNWQPDDRRGKFRTWLFRIAKNQLLTHMTRRHSIIARSTHQGEVADALIERWQASPESELIADEERIYQGEVFRSATARAKRSVSPMTWDAFWRTSVGGESIEEVAKSLSLSRAAIYVARSRVIGRLKIEIQRLESGLTS